MTQQKALVTPLFYLDKIRQFRIADDGFQWVIETRQGDSFYVNLEPDDIVFPLFGRNKWELILAIRENGIPTCVQSRKILAVFWWEYTDYCTDLKLLGRAAATKTLINLSDHADPVEEELLLSREEFRVRPLRLRQLASRDNCAEQPPPDDYPDAPLH